MREQPCPDGRGHDWITQGSTITCRWCSAEKPPRAVSEPIANPGQACLWIVVTGQACVTFADPGDMREYVWGTAIPEDHPDAEALEASFAEDFDWLPLEDSGGRVWRGAEVDVYALAPGDVR